MKSKKITKKVRLHAWVEPTMKRKITEMAKKKKWTESHVIRIVLTSFFG